MHHTLTLIWQFYKPFLYYNLLANAFGLFLILSNSNAFALALPAKLVSYGGVFFYQHYFHQQEYFYYRNAGSSMRRTYVYAFLPDLLLFIVLSILCIIIK